jgi:hypothetical protein
MAVEITCISDGELERLARVGGPHSVEVMLLTRLRRGRAKDRQFFAFRVGEYYFTGPTPDARTERKMIELAEEHEEE